MEKLNFTALKKRAMVIIICMIILMLPCFMVMPSFAAKNQISDISITDAVEDELYLDSAVPSHLIDVSTTDGIVTLEGEVDNILASDRALRIARIVKGVRAVVNKIKVVPSMLRMDWDIREDVKEALLTDPATDSYEVDVNVNNNVVTLSGKVDSWQEKNLCETVAKGVKGVKEVNNEILVSVPEKRSDYEIKQEVEKALKWDAFVDHALIDVKVNDSKVVLTGVVGSAAEKSWAYWDAYVAGVKEVDESGLDVERWARDNDLRGQKYVKKTDKEVEEAVRDAMLYDPRVLSFKITPEASVDGTYVTLRGTVDNLKAKRAAEQDTRNTVGVRYVTNRIKVRPELPLSDKKIKDKIEDALMRDPYVNSYDINVGVINGVVYLYGSVDTYFEKIQVDDVVSKVNGVITVDNNLDVQNNDYYTYDPYVDDNYIYDYEWYDNRPRFPSKSDWQIKVDIENELFWSPFVDGDDVKVAVDDGIVTLTGKVDSWSEYNAAANNAYEGGAVYVDNDLTVK